MADNQGKVYLIGAGPGDPELITLKAKKALNDCDAVVYDHLVPLELIVGLRSNVERFYAGKSAGQHTMPQDEINKLLVKLAKENKLVGRLKGGDPFVFGRGGEEAIHLKKHGILYEIIPGITAGVAAAAAAGIPVTHRGKSVFTIFLTAHETPDKGNPQIPWDSFAKLENGTLVGYMSVGQLKSVTEKLMAGGMKADTPACVVERGTTGKQKVVSGILKNIFIRSEEANIAPPALFIIGEVVALRSEIEPISDTPLRGKTIMVTRPGQQASSMYREIRKLGGEVLPLPSITTEGHFSTSSWETFKKIDSGWLIFTSENGVRYFFKQFTENGFDLRRMSDFKIAAIGFGTEKALNNYNLKPDFIPKSFTVKALADELGNSFEWNGVKVVRVRGNLGDTIIEDRLTELGAKVYSHEIYVTSTTEWDAGMRAAFEEAERIDIVTFTSGSTVTGLREILGDEEFKRLFEKSAAISIGPMTSAILSENGIEASIEANPHTVDGVIEAILNHFNQ